jgi:glycosyltransferase involved in cell wall biosynthesis
MTLRRLKLECSARRLQHVAFRVTSPIARHLPTGMRTLIFSSIRTRANLLALVAPNEGGVASYANASNAWLADAAPAAFADAIGAVQADPIARVAKTEAARKTAERHRWPDITARYLQLYRELQAITQGERRAETIAARTWSTPGDQFGKRID